MSLLVHAIFETSVALYTLSAALNSSRKSFIRDIHTISRFQRWFSLRESISCPNIRFIIVRWLQKSSASRGIFKREAIQK